MAGIHVLCSSVLLLASCATVHPPSAGESRAEPLAPNPSTSAVEPLPEATGEPPTGALPAASSSAASSSAASAPTASASSPQAAPGPPGVPASLEFGKLKFEGGEVPKAEASVQKLRKALTACVNDGGGVRGDGARGSMSFLVRAAGIAEGVSLAADGLDESVRRCIQKAADKKRIGDPSSDPVGVTVELIFTPKRP